MGNQTVWKSDNQGLKEETFFETGRRGGDGQQGRKDSRQGGGWRTGAGRVETGGRAVPHSRADKLGGTTRE